MFTLSDALTSFNAASVPSGHSQSSRRDFHFVSRRQRTMFVRIVEDAGCAISISSILLDGQLSARSNLAIASDTQMGSRLRKSDVSPNDRRGTSNARQHHRVRRGCRYGSRSIGIEIRPADCRSKTHDSGKGDRKPHTRALVPSPKRSASPRETSRLAAMDSLISA